MSHARDTVLALTVNKDYISLYRCFNKVWKRLRWQLLPHLGLREHLTQCKDIVRFLNGGKTMMCTVYNTSVSGVASLCKAPVFCLRVDVQITLTRLVVSHTSEVQLSHT